MIEEIRGDLTEKISDISSSSELNGETIKLLKEMTTIIKELDKLIKDDKESSDNATDNQLEFLQSLKNNTLIHD
ncbi:MAG: hypothetical protein R3Y04_03730 [Rikenellaceae bacterium]